ncbi:acetyl-CoA carboxylase biotin carboxyl carrier protein [Clostridium algidicarnis]|uniref:acetyl-CoA carboxylase biotin carboxyl carrier protein n=1 Tax=Clostridium algidicarnis TaxID=37659 RepID=UPI001C0B6B88|nr:acetyl-CoA carboxylase biotin carboxyl carrier protein [Clostridium algidicarnis]MBU3195247.1 acetyl-CoA carboxylase biotin carboxyl carrier protein [Clostridium algidicarnis]MBU3208206.1 acetyl-CoA carboxylase biotin carboxyl carrier protein [Clostridium algidicarnis]MBU3227562.1 acetyl-CoA carboxylase biotin carboxyl carrier protein [Clostridium algidicarnis]MBU3251031.1 acetyl-CoA carboxylase biotin carboxyl carrier protein [Clostridium algidicarnis]
MDFSKIQELIKAVSESSLTSFEFKCDGTQINMKKECEKIVVKENLNLEELNEETKNMQIQYFNEEDKEDKIITDIEENFNVVKSPIVGTFYKSSGPKQEPFVKAGDKVKKGEVLCIVEAMKLMNEIESEFEGEVVEILAQDGEMVEYGEPLIKIKYKLCINQ